MLTGNLAGHVCASARKPDAGGDNGLAGEVGVDEVAAGWVFRCSVKWPR